MFVIALLVLVSIILGAASLALFLWTLKIGQYDDLDGAAERILIDENETDTLD